MRDVSRPAPGSVTPKHTCRSPVDDPRQRPAFNSSEPCLTTGCMPKIDRWMALAAFIAAARPRDLLGEQRGLGDAEPVAAVLLGDRHAEPAAVGDRVDRTRSGIRAPGLFPSSSGRRTSTPARRPTCGSALGHRSARSSSHRRALRHLLIIRRRLFDAASAWPSRRRQSLLPVRFFGAGGEVRERLRPTSSRCVC